MMDPKPIPMTKVIDALLDGNMPFHPRYLNRMSDLEPADAKLLADSWLKVPVRRREAILEDMQESHIADDLLNFEEVARLALTDPEPGVRTRAIHILREYELVDLMPTYMDMTQHDPDSEVRAGAAAALATFIFMGEVEDISANKLKKVEECLLGLTNGSDVKLVRRRALEALGYSSRKEVIPLIKNAYASNDNEWLITALFAMGRSANSGWKPQVLKMLFHDDPEVRAEAAGAAGELEISEAVPTLLQMLKDSDLDVRMASIWSLSQIGGRGVREALEHQLEFTDDDEEAEQTESALENLDFTEEMKDLNLLEIMESGDEDIDSSEDEPDENIE